MLAVPAILLSFALLGRADPVPNEPGPGEVFNAGSTCKIGWTLDTTGLGTTMNIGLMTGDNWNMVHLTSECLFRCGARGTEGESGVLGVELDELDGEDDGGTGWYGCGSAGL